MDSKRKSKKSIHPHKPPHRKSIAPPPDPKPEEVVEEEHPHVQFDFNDDDTISTFNPEIEESRVEEIVENNDATQTFKQPLPFPDEGGAGDEDSDADITILKVKQPLEEDSQEELTHQDEIQNVDINRLVYAPKAPAEVKKEKCIYYLVEYVMILFNFTTLMLTAYEFIMGLTLMSFKSSMESIALRDTDTHTKSTPTILYAIKGYSSSSTALFFIFGSLFQMLNIVIGSFATVHGYRNILILHIFLCILFLMAELLTGALIWKDSHCDKKDLEIIQERFMEYIRIYGTTAKDEADEEIVQSATYQLDSIQHGLSCCGAQSWSDYMNPIVLKNGKADEAFPTRLELDGVEMVLPASCCRPWWVRNIHCARGSHLWAHPAVDEETSHIFRERISQAGCMWRIKQGCNRIVFLIGMGLLIMGAVDAGFVLIKLICTLIILRRIYQILKKKKTQDKGEGVLKDVPGRSLEEMPMPTEDQVEIIKARSDFNKFEVQLKRTQIGEWMRHVKKSVYTVGNIQLQDEETSDALQKGRWGRFGGGKQSNKKSSRMAQPNPKRKSLTKKEATVDVREISIENLDAEDVLKREIQREIKRRSDVIAKKKLNTIHHKKKGKH